MAAQRRSRMTDRRGGTSPRRSQRSAHRPPRGNSQRGRDAELIGQRAELHAAREREAVLAEATKIGRARAARRAGRARACALGGSPVATRDGLVERALKIATMPRGRIGPSIDEHSDRRFCRHAAGGSAWLIRPLRAATPSPSIRSPRKRAIGEKIAADLTAIAAAIGDRGKIHEFFASPVVPRPDKERLLTEAFGEKVDPVALHTLLLLVRKRETLLGALVKEFLALQRAARGAETLVMTSARPLERHEYAELVERLERAYGKKFEPHPKRSIRSSSAAYGW